MISEPIMSETNSQLPVSIKQTIQACISLKTYFWMFLKNLIWKDICIKTAIQHKNHDFFFSKHCSHIDAFITTRAFHRGNFPTWFIEPGLQITRTSVRRRSLGAPPPHQSPLRPSYNSETIILVMPSGRSQQLCPPTRKKTTDPAGSGKWWLIPTFLLKMRFAPFNPNHEHISFV